MPKEGESDNEPTLFGSAQERKRLEEAEDLARQIRYHDKLYWEKHTQKISDAEYDQLRERLRRIAPDHPQLQSIGERPLGTLSSRATIPAVSSPPEAVPSDSADAAAFWEAEQLERRLCYHAFLYCQKNECGINYDEYAQLRERLKRIHPKLYQEHSARLWSVLQKEEEKGGKPNAHFAYLRRMLQGLPIDDAPSAQRLDWNGLLHPPRKHSVPMLSIEKTIEDSNAVVKWATKAGAFAGSGPQNGLVASVKVDGSSCSLLYYDGRLVRAVTRGNGLEGDDITANAMTSEGVPPEVPQFRGNRVEVRGEVYMPFASFRAVMEEFERKVNAGDAKEEDWPIGSRNPRNCCAGGLKQNDPRDVAKLHLAFIAHSCPTSIPGANGATELSNLQRLSDLRFRTPPFVHVRTTQQVRELIARFKADRDIADYPTDGVVFTLNNLALHAELGSTPHHPRYKLAFKFSRDRGETTVTAIEWATSRNGRVCPTMVVEPIPLGGATVTYCTVHNAKTVKAVGLKPGDRVLLEREVIPYFVQKVKPEAAPSDQSLPKRCPSCGAELGWDETETHLLCSNLGGCTARRLDYLEYYCSRAVTNMLGIGPEVIKKLADAGLIATPADLYTLTEQQIVAKIEREGETSARNKVAAIQARREQTLDVFLVSLGIRGLGPSVASRLANHFGTLDALQAATPEKLMEVEGVAETMAAGIHGGLRERQGLIAALLKHLALRQAEKTAGPLTGKSFCLTGEVAFDYGGKHFGIRREIEDLIRSKGGAVKSVSKGLSFLVVGDDPGSNKLEKAKKAGIATTDAAGLLRMLE